MISLNRINSIAALLALLATNQRLVAFVDADVFVCGSDYTDASKNCTVNTACPSGDGCPDDKATCFSVPEEKCVGPTIVPSEAPSLSPMLVCGYSYDDALTNCRSNPECIDGNCANETHACFPIPVDLCPTYAPSYSPTTVPKVCGVDSLDAQANCLDLSMRCPSGDGCPTGKACFNVPIDVCGPMKDPTMSPTVGMIIGSTVSPSTTNMEGSSVSPTAVTTNQTSTMSPTVGMIIGSTVSPSAATTNMEGSSISPTAVTTNQTSTNQTMTPSESAAITSSNPTTSPSTAMPITSAPSASPIYSTFFCGETYELAEANCWTAEPCPSGSGCSKAGEDCYGISADRCYSAAPTESPTGPGPRPSTSPSVTAAPSDIPSSSTIPTMLPTLSPSASPIVNTFYCGMDYETAATNCASATPCPSGTCPSGMTCFGNIQCATASPSSVTVTIASPAPSVPSLTITPDTVTTAPASLSGPSSSMPPYWEEIADETTTSQNTTVTSAPATSAPATSAPVTSVPAEGMNSPKPSSSGTNAPTSKQVDFDPNNTFYCGDDYNDAYTNCYTQVACPSGAKEECPTGQSCFPIASCSTPSPAASVGPTTSGGLSTTLPPGTILPSSNSTGTLAPTWDFSNFGPNGSSGDRNDCTDVMLSVSVKSLIWFGVVIGLM
jgi:hypothetical protein